MFASRRWDAIVLKQPVCRSATDSTLLQRMGSEERRCFGVRAAERSADAALVRSNPHSRPPRLSGTLRPTAVGRGGKVARTVPVSVSLQLPGSAGRFALPIRQRGLYPAETQGR